MSTRDDIPEERDPGRALEQRLETSHVEGDRVIELIPDSTDAYERETRVKERPFSAADNHQMEATARRVIAYILTGMLAVLVLGFIVLAFVTCPGDDERLTSYTAAAAPYTTLIAAVTTYYFTRQSNK